MRSLFTLLITHVAFSCFSQSKTDTIYYTSDWKETGLMKVMSYYAIKEYDSAGFSKSRYFTINGTLHSETNELNDSLHGLCIWYHSNGTKSKVGNYDHYRRTGEFKEYDQQGYITSLKTYENNQIVKRIDYVSGTGEILKIIEGQENFPTIESQFPGGPDSLQSWLTQNVNYPRESIEMNEQGKVYVSFVVEIDGSISNVEVIKSVSQQLDTEAMRLARAMPNWTPGEYEGELARTRCQIPINFTLIDGKEKKGKRRR